MQFFCYSKIDLLLHLLFLCLKAILEFQDRKITKLKLSQDISPQFPRHISMETRLLKFKEYQEICFCDSCYKINYYESNCLDPEKSNIYQKLNLMRSLLYNKRQEKIQQFFSFVVDSFHWYKLVLIPSKKPNYDPKAIWKIIKGKNLELRQK